MQSIPMAPFHEGGCNEISTMTRLKFATLCLTMAGGFLLLQSIFGCYAIMGIGFSTTRNIVTDLCLTIAFPIYLLRFVSRRLTTVCLWIFFLIQWANMCSLGLPPHFISPVDDIHDATLLLGIVLFTLADAVLASLARPRRAALP